jgi:excisionase family DNA binding protein
MRLTIDEILADNARMEQFVCERIPPDTTRVDLGCGAWADLTPFWDDRFGWSLLLETDEPEWVDLREVYQHFRRREMGVDEWRREMMLDHGSRVSGTRPQKPSARRLDEASALTVKEAATELTCSISFVYKLMAHGHLAYERRGRRKLPTAASVHDYRQRNLVPARPQASPPPPAARPPYNFKYLFKGKKGGSHV